MCCRGSIMRRSASAIASSPSNSCSVSRFRCARDLQDDCPRKVYFFPKTGKVLVKRLRTLVNDTLLSRERDYQRQIRVDRGSGAVESFCETQTR